VSRKSNYNSSATNRHEIIRVGNDRVEGAIEHSAEHTHTHIAGLMDINIMRVLLCSIIVVTGNEYAIVELAPRDVISRQRRAQSH
jgi:hypothetical protein